MQKDWNGLDKAIFRLAKSTAELPEVFRRLTEGGPLRAHALSPGNFRYQDADP